MMTRKDGRRSLVAMYEALYRRFGPQYWWPADSAFEIIIGSILTQNTAWQNVEKAIAALKENRACTAVAMARLGRRTLARLIRPAGYYNVKAGRIMNFLKVFRADYRGSIARMSRLSTDELREALLSINGIGPETADSIALYVFKRPLFVVDAYTKRVFSRHGYVPNAAPYHAVQSFAMDRLPHDEKLYNEFHALIVRLGKEYCRKKPRCQSCPLKFAKQISSRERDE